jgi:hypothetical protein
VDYAFDEANGIHRIVFLKPTRDAIEAWVNIMDSIYAGLTSEDHVRFLFDERPSGPLPLTYSINRGMRWARGLEQHPNVRLAFLFPDRMVASLANSMLGMVQRQMGHLSVRLFNPDQEAQAIAWLTDPNWPAKK